MHKNSLHCMKNLKNFSGETPLNPHYWEGVTPFRTDALEVLRRRPNATSGADENFWKFLLRTGSFGAKVYAITGFRGLQ